MVSDMLQCVLSFQSKVGLLISNLQSAEFTHHFPKLACITTERPELKDHYRPEVFVTYMTQLREKFEARFGDFCNRKVLLHFLQNPFVVPVRATSTELAQIGAATVNSDSEFLELQADFDLQAIHSTCSVPEFWFKVPQEKYTTLTSGVNIRTLSEELLQSDEAAINLQKDKEHLEELNQQAFEDLQAEEEKVNLLTKEKANLQVQTENLEYHLEQEKKHRSDLEKTKQKLEGDIKMTIENLNEMEKLKTDLEEIIKKKDLEINTMNNKLEEEESLSMNLQKKNKEFHITK
ncbi:UNVERIFIED_CONTAM: hypothetical protein FKN15_056924 [Acipenser sinensis]